LGPDTADAAIERALQRCRTRRVPLLWWVGPLSRPDDLGARLVAHGFTMGEAQPGMAGELDRLPAAAGPPDLVVERARSAGALRLWWSLACDVHGRPHEIVEPAARCYARMALAADAPMRCYLGWWRGKPVATSCVVLGAGVAGLYGVATLPAVRRQGIGTAMTLAPLREAAALGYRVAVLRASVEGRPMYEKMGFREYCRVATYVWQCPEAPANMSSVEIREDRWTRTASCS
jgi:GNAT superfamily N-acetyltransferase